MPGYDEFRTGLTYRDVLAMLRAADRHRRRGSVLGFWHEVKLQLYEQAVDLGLRPGDLRPGGLRPEGYDPSDRSPGGSP